MRINWRANDGYWFPDPGKITSVKCGVCNAKMDVKRNVLGHTSWAGAMAGIKRRHDSFFCPHYTEDWHKRISALKRDVYHVQINRSKIAYRKIKKEAAKEIRKLLKTHAAR